VVVGAEVVFVVELPRVAFIADCAVEEADGRWEGVVSLGGGLVMRGEVWIWGDVLVAWSRLCEMCRGVGMWTR